MTHITSSMILRILLITLFFFPANTFATMVDGMLTNLAGNRWQADYTVTNDTLASPIEEITIWFALGLYDNLSVLSTPSSWDAIAINPDPFIPDDGFYDALALSSGIGAGASLGGFSMAFDWLGSASTPISQFFEVVDPFTFNVLESGQTSLSVSNPNPTPVPVPDSALLTGTGLLFLLLLKKQGILKRS